MTDPLFGVVRLPDAGAALDYAGANAIEQNLYALSYAWPAFESEQRLDKVGSYGYLQLDESASPAPGVEVTLVRWFPRLLVLVTGSGLENLSWKGTGWAEENGVLVYTMTETSVYNANAALGQLVFSATGDVDAVITLAGENIDWEPEVLRYTGEGWTKLLFRTLATWGLARAKRHTWGGAKPLTWGEAARMRKGD